MKLPNLSESMYVARLRYVQSIHESPERRNPDTMVWHFVPARQRFRMTWLGRQELAKMRAEPFYHYLIARTKYYDQVLNEAVADGVQRIVIIGCGSDTRAYRFQELLRSKGVSVLECDQPAAIQVKQQMTKRWRKTTDVGYLAIDLNDDAWPDLARWLGDRRGPKTLVLMEGVSPYVDERSFSQFLKFLAVHLSPGSHVAYDFKIRGVNDNEGRAGRTKVPFRLSRQRDEAQTFHSVLQLGLRHLELSDELTVRLLPGLPEPGRPLFSQDGLLRLQVD